MSETILELNNINKFFCTDEMETRALNNINLSIAAGEYVSISGASGCGKSTLLSVMGLLDVATSGSYCLAGRQVESLTSNERASFRNKNLGFIFQSFNLIGDMTVAQNIEMPLLYRRGVSKAERTRRVNEALEKVNISNRKSHYPGQLSGGQQQRVAIARALVGEPAVLLADEPTGNLDSKNSQMVMELLSELHRTGTTVCMVTHDKECASQASRHIELFDGQLISDNAELPYVLAS